MKAWQVTRNGDPREALRQAEVAVPSPGPGQLLVRVVASALNFPDVLLCLGRYHMQLPLPFTPGLELCGKVTELGEGVDGWDAGERVIGNPILPGGAFTQFVLMDAAATFRAPAVLSDQAAAALHIAYQTAWFGLHRRAQIQPGETLLVHAAAGGVGSAAVQVGKAAGAQVIAVAGGPRKTEAAAKLGADVVIDRLSQDFVAVVNEVTAGRGANVVFDPVGGDAYTGSTNCVAFEGRILVIGFAGGTVPSPPLNHVLGKNYSIVGLHWGRYREREPGRVAAAHEELSVLAGTGAIAPLIGDCVTFDQVPGALARLADGDAVGRLVIVL